MKIFKLLFTAIFFATTFHSQAQTFSAAGGSIPDVGPPVYFHINVAGLAPSTITPSHGLVTVCINITHTYDGDLTAQLQAPDGTLIPLFTNVGGGGNNFTNTCLDTTGATSITSGSAPFTGIYQPEGWLGNFNNGHVGNGQWTLIMQDVGPVDTGSVTLWSLTFGANAPHASNFTNDIPLVVINTNGQGINSGAGIIADMKLIDHGPGNPNNEHDTGNIYTGKINIAIRGSYSSSLPQKPYSFTILNDSATADSNVVLLGLPIENDFILQATYNDKSFVRNTLMFDMFQHMGHYATRSRYCEVVLNGNYIGIYFICEKIKRDANRVNVNKMLPTDTSGDELTGGYIFKHDYSGPGWTSQFSPPGCTNRFYDYDFVYPRPNNIQTQQANYIHHYIDSFETRLYNVNVYDTANGYSSFVDHNSFEDYMLLNELANNIDGYKKSMFFYKYKNSVTDKLFAGPVWDFDWSLKHVSWVPLDGSGWSYQANPCDGDVLFLPWWQVMMSDTNFQNETRCRYEFFRQSFYDTSYINHFIDSVANYLNNAQQRHFTRWNILGQNVGTPELNPVAPDFPSELDTLKKILRLRIAFLDVNLPGHCYNPIFPAAVENVNEGNDFVLYPNPTENELKISEFRMRIEKIEIVNELGEIVFEKKNIFSNSVSVDVSNLAAGIYFVKISDDKNVTSIKKLVKE